MTTSPVRNIASQQDWVGLRGPNALGLALLDPKAPCCLAADPDLCAVLHRDAGALDGVPLGEIETAHPFAGSIAAWRRHVRHVRKAGALDWNTWLAQADGPVRRARFRLSLRSLSLPHLGRREVLLAELLDAGLRSEIVSRNANWMRLDDIPTGACRIARDGSVLASNALANGFLDFEFDASSRSYRVRLPRRVLSGEGKEMAARDLPWARAFARGERPAPQPLGRRDAQGRISWVLLSVAPEFGTPGLLLDSSAGTPSNEISSALLILTDITSAKESSDALRDADHKLQNTISSVTSLQDQLARSEHMASLGLMAAGVAHEINNPLSYILSNLAFAAERAIDQESRLALREALEGAGRVRDIVRDLKTLSRMESEEELKPVDVRNAVDAALKLAFDEIRNRARLQRHFSEVPRAWGDETRLVQVMLNLVTNAAQSISPGAPDDNQICVEVKLCHEGPEAGARQVEIVVSDTGVGIPASHLPKVFEPFFTTKPAGEGTGLGLSICHRLVHGMGGHIRVSSEEGRGSRFSVLLNAASVADTDTPTLDQTLTFVRRMRLLIVDDELLVARAAQRIFDGHFRVEIALDGAAALQKLSAQEYDVVLCDVMMPGMSGIDVYREVRARDEALAARFVFATGGLYNQELRDSVELLSNMIVEKPFDTKKLRGMIERAASSRQNEAEDLTSGRGRGPQILGQ